MQREAVIFENITQIFGSFRALADVSFSVQTGSFHGLVGENGAGKSTAMKILYGLLKPTKGRLIVGGNLVRWGSPKQSIRAGIGMVHQHFMLAPSATVLENVLIGHEPPHPLLGFLPAVLQPNSFAAAAEKISQMCTTYGFEMNLHERIENLSVGEQQRVEILKLLYRNAQVLILDEPTAVLTPSETTQLLAQLKKLCANGKTVILISHKLKEILSAADMVTVLRQGKVVTTTRAAELSESSLAELMVGKKLQRMNTELLNRHKTASTNVKPILVLKDLDMKKPLGLQHKSSEKETNRTGNRGSSTSPAKSLDAVTLELQPGEIVGIAGVEGNGQSELLRVLTDPAGQKFTGSYSLFGTRANRLSPAKVKQLGLVYIPEDRHRSALLLDASMVQNICLGRLQHKSLYLPPKWLRFLNLLNFSLLDTLADAAIAEYDIRPAQKQMSMRAFSGGNQQKLVVARELGNKPRLIIAAQPTRGVDIGAAQVIHRKLVEASLAGAGVLLVSSELDEVLKLSHRILVLYRGQVVGRFERAQFDEEKIGLCMGGSVQ